MGQKLMVKKTGPRVAAKTDVVLGQKIKALRDAQRLSQTELGVCLGVSFQQIQKYEKGINRITADRLQRLAAFLNVELTEFYDLGGSEPFKSVIINNDARSIKILRAYNKIENVETRHRMVLLMESIADKYA